MHQFQHCIDSMSELFTSNYQWFTDFLTVLFLRVLHLLLTQLKCFFVCSCQCFRWNVCCFSNNNGSWNVYGISITSKYKKSEKKGNSDSFYSNICPFFVHSCILFDLLCFDTVTLGLGPNIQLLAQLMNENREKKLFDWINIEPDAS